MNTLTITLEFDGLVHGQWKSLSAQIDGKDVDIDADVVGPLMGIEVHYLDASTPVVIYDNESLS